MRKNNLILITLISILIFSACGNAAKDSDSSGSMESSDQNQDGTKSNLELLENEKNVSGNGVIFIEDSADYPDSIREVYIPFQDETSGLYGYCNVDGKILKEAVYTDAMGFYDDVAFVCEDESYYLINKSFEPISDNTYDYAGEFINGSAFVMKGISDLFINSKEEKVECNFWGEFTKPEDGAGPYGNRIGGLYDGTYYMPYSEGKIGTFSMSENYVAYYDKDNNELARFDGYSSCTSFNDGYAFLNGVVIINSDFEIVGEAEYFISGEDFYEYASYYDIWDGTYYGTHIYDDEYFIGQDKFQSDLTQKYKVIKIAPELYDPDM